MAADFLPLAEMGHCLASGQVGSPTVSRSAGKHRRLAWELQWEEVMTRPSPLKKPLLQPLLSMAFLSLGASACGGPIACLVAGTLISTPTGPVPIERIEPGQPVFAFNEEDHCVTVCQVTHVFRHEDREYGTLLLCDGRRLLVTANHPVYVADRASYIPAGEIRAGDEVLLLEESASAPPRLHRGRVEQALTAATERATVFDLTVDDKHNYFAGGILVHNKSLALPPTLVAVHRSGDGAGFIGVQIVDGQGGSSSERCTAADCSYTQPYGREPLRNITATAYPAPGSYFDSWSADAASCGSSAYCFLNGTSSALSVSAKFSLCTSGMWCPVPVATATLLTARDIWVSSKYEAWIVADPSTLGGSAPLGPVLWRFDGQSLTPDHAPVATDKPLQAIAGFSPTDAWAVGRRGAVLHWNGQTWSPEASPVRLDLRAVRAEPQVAWAVGEGGQIIQRTGGVWSLVGSGTDSDLNGVTSFGPTDAWAVGNEGTILHWDGAAWKLVPSGTNKHLGGVWGSATNDLWAVGQSGTILHWDGTAWQSVASNTQFDLIGVRGTGPLKAVAYGTYGTVLNWDGTDWKASPVALDPLSSVYSVWPSLTGDTLAVTYSAVLRLNP